MRELNERVRNAADTNLRRERDGLRATLDAMNDGMCRLDRKGRVVLANEVALSLLGCRERDLLHTPILGRFIFVVEGVRHGGEDLLDSIAKGRTLRRLNGVVTRADGHETPIECNLEPIPSTGQERNSVLSFRDLTDHQRVREALERSQAHYGSLIHRAPIAFMEEDFSAVGDWLDQLRRSGVTELDDWLNEHPDELRHAASLIQVVDANAAAVEMLGATSPADLRGSLDPNTITSDTLTSFRDQVEGMWEDRDLTVTRVSGSRINGERLEAILHWSAPRIFGSLDLTRAVVGMVDITDLTEAQERTQELILSKDKFLAAISHELRTPLTGVNVSAALLDESADDLDAAERKELVGYIRQQSDDMAQIVEDLLVAARADIGALSLLKEEVSVADELAAVLSRFGDAWTKVGLEGVDDTKVLADPLRFRQIMRNLLTNANRYGGDHVSILQAHGPRTTVLSVFDNGPGVPADEMEAIFEPYYRAGTSPGIQGSVGMGLSVARQLAALMDGTLTYHRVDDHSEFRLSLPSA